MIKIWPSFKSLEILPTRRTDKNIPLFFFKLKAIFKVHFVSFSEANHSVMLCSGWRALSDKAKSLVFSLNIESVSYRRRHRCSYETEWTSLWRTVLLGVVKHQQCLIFIFMWLVSYVLKGDRWQNRPAIASVNWIIKLWERQRGINVHYHRATGCLAVSVSSANI